ncbi:MAG TPA: DUF2807 domain-containing protein [Spirochaetes bacterium]|nr:DUF2807 domain-containing protein [Spirochaetota bacterium]
MDKGGIVSETREVKGFERVVMRDYGELVITQGEKESLTVEAEPGIIEKIRTEVRGGNLDISIGASWLRKIGHAFTSSISGSWIKYSLTVKKLTGLEVLGAARVSVTKIKTERFSLVLGGAGYIKVESLEAKQLDVDMRGAGKVELTGKASEQNIIMGGAGGYVAPKLESAKANVDLRGAGIANVWVTKDLEVTITGVGNVKYYGAPAIKQKITGLGKLTPMGSPQ